MIHARMLSNTARREHESPRMTEPSDLLQPRERSLIRVERASTAERALIEGMSRFYIYDFSEMESAGSDEMDFDQRGDFGVLPYLPEYWTESGRHALLIRLGDKPVGFALINTHSHRGGSIERNMGEFFVARKYRRRGVAAEAVGQILALYPGRWEVAVVERNIAAKAFWPRAIAAAPNASDLVRLEGDGEHWRGPIWTFLASTRLASG
jgi:predicted acetyltransferase